MQTTTLSLGERLREARTARGWSRAELARQATACLSPEAIRQIELGLIVDPGVAKVHRLVYALGFTLDVFFCHETQGARKPLLCLDNPP